MRALLLLASTSADEDRAMLLFSGALALAALGGLVGSVVLLRRGRVAWGVLAGLASLTAGAVAVALGGLLLLAAFAWH